jgi:hypothetical protein
VRGTVLSLNTNTEQGTLRDDLGVVWKFGRADLVYWMDWLDLQPGSAVIFGGKATSKTPQAINIRPDI